MAVEHHITRYSQFFTGEDKVLSVTILQSDGETAQDISSWTALSYMVKEDPEDDDADALITKTVGSGITVTDAANGELTIAVDDDDLEDLDAETNYYHELKRMDAGFETVLLYGRFQLSQAVHSA